VGGTRLDPVALPPEKRPGTYCTGVWMGPRVRLDGCGKSRPHWDSIPGPSSPSRVAIPIRTKIKFFGQRTLTTSNKNCTEIHSVVSETDGQDAVKTCCLFTSYSSRTERRTLLERQDTPRLPLRAAGLPDTSHPLTRINSQQQPTHRYCTTADRRTRCVRLPRVGQQYPPQHRTSTPVRTQ
jgi:hypothetical protein